jgi:hypothetical protein
MSLLSPAEIKKLKAQDRRLITEFDRKFPHLKRRLLWRNSEVKRLAERTVGTRAGLAKLESFGVKKGLFEIRFERRPWRDSDGERRVFTLARAASTGMFPMGTHFWIRDNAIIGARFAKIGDRRQQLRGRDVLLSCLTFMSSVAQLKRFEAIVRAKSRAFIKNVDNWPRIFAAIDDNLTTERHEGWAHKQDAWQILAWHVFEALEEGRLAHDDLTDKHKRFLGLVVPFLAKVSFWRSENSGSWEEIEAVRTSVRAWEHRLIVRMAELSQKPKYRFLLTGYSQLRRYLGKRFSKVQLGRAVEILDREVSRAMLADLPYESPMYPRTDPRFRRGDATLIYLLELDYVAFLGERTGKGLRWVRSMEDRILREILALADERSGGITRYQRDTYQRAGFFRALTTATLIRLYGAPSGNASGNFSERHRIVPRGRQAAWTHFVWQLAAWAGGRFLATGERRFALLHDRFFTQGLRLITGKEGSLDLDERNSSRIVKLPSWRMPECYIADTAPNGAEMQFPSPHTPLNWAVCEMFYAFRVRSSVLEKRESQK